MQRPTPCPTLFPYTTLFRSQDQWDQVVAKAQKLTTISRSTGVIAWAGPKPDRTIPLFAVGFKGWKHSESALEALDRKSTRLNSSHPSISYAVFCLKKKTISP